MSRKKIERIEKHAINQTRISFLKAVFGYRMLSINVNTRCIG